MSAIQSYPNHEANGIQAKRVEALAELGGHGCLAPRFPDFADGIRSGYALASALTA